MLGGNIRRVERKRAEVEGLNSGPALYYVTLRKLPVFELRQQEKQALE